MKFKVINKFVDFLGNDILKIGDIIEPNENNEYIIEYNNGDNRQTIQLTIDGVKNAKQNGLKIFEEIKEDIEIIIEELPEDDDILVRNWRIQLDVKTTRKKLKEFERKFRESIGEL
jgi:tRNA splicing ligase